jgi:PAS domain S-box-containing protein
MSHGNRMRKQKSGSGNGPPRPKRGAAAVRKGARLKLNGPAGSRAADAQEAKPASNAEDRYRRLVELMPDAITVEADGVCIFANQALVRLLGGSHVSEFLGTPVLGWVHPLSRARVEERRRQIAAGGQAVTEEKLLRRDGSTVDVEVAMLPFIREDKSAALIIFHDITRRKRALQALRDSENLFRQVVDSDMVGLLFWDIHGHVTYANSAFLRMVGFAHKDVLAGRVRWKELTAPEHAHLDERAMRELSAEGVCTPYEKEFVRADGQRVPVLIGGAMLQDSKESGVSFCLDVTQRRRIEQERDRLFQELSQAHDRLRSLSGRLVEVQEAERRRIARELHDEVGQELTALKLRLQRMDGPSTASALGALESVDRVLSLVRDMSLELRPTMLDDLGLAPALCGSVIVMRRLAPPGAVSALPHRGRRFPADIETAAYRIVQEALTNVVRHSGAAEANVLLWASDERLTVQVEDRGRGFDVEAGLSAGTSSGLSGMRERVALLGGRFSLESTPHSGTHLTAELPLQVPAEFPLQVSAETGAPLR